MTALREAVKTVLADRYPALHIANDNGLCDAIISAVLAAADAGESEGPWRVMTDQYGSEVVSHGESMRRLVQDVGIQPFGEPEARAVCNALNRIALTGAGRGA